MKNPSCPEVKEIWNFVTKLNSLQKKLNPIFYGDTSVWDPYMITVYLKSIQVETQDSVSRTA